MKETTETLFRMIVEQDGGISEERRDAALAILKGRVPTRWPAYLAQAIRLEGMASLAGEPCDKKEKAARPVYLRRTEAAKYLTCSVRLVDELKRTGELPFHRVGRHLIALDIPC